MLYAQQLGNVLLLSSAVKRIVSTSHKWNISRPVQWASELLLLLMKHHYLAIIDHLLALSRSYSMRLFMTAELKVNISICRVTALTRGSVKSIANTTPYSSEQRQATWCTAGQAAMLIIEEWLKLEGFLT